MDSIAYHPHIYSLQPKFVSLAGNTRIFTHSPWCIKSWSRQDPQHRLPGGLMPEARKYLYPVPILGGGRGL